MIPAFVFILVIYSVALAGVCFWSAIRGRGPERWQLAWVLALEGGLIVQAVTAIVLALRGHGAHRPAVVVGYMLTSVIVLPAVAWYAKKGATRWDSLMLGITALVLAVVIGRLGMTWAEGG